MKRLRLISRDKARNLGLTRYYDGSGCSRRHDSERYVRSGTCIACATENWNRSNGRTSKGNKAATRLEPRTGTPDGFISAIPKSRLMGARA